MKDLKTGGLISLRSKEEMKAAFSKYKKAMPKTDNKELEDAIYEVMYQAASKATMQFNSDLTYIFNLPDMGGNKPAAQSGTYTIDTKAKTISTQIKGSKDKSIINYLLENKLLTLTYPNKNGKGSVTMVFEKAK